MIIKNFDELSTSNEKRIVLELINAGIESVLPKKVISKSVSYNDKILRINEDEYDLSNRKIFVIGAGKASGAMAEALENILADKIAGGVVNHKGGNFKTKLIKLNVAGHPIPTIEGLKGIEKMLALKSVMNQDDIVICLISGGGSALLPYPVDEISFEKKQLTSELLVGSGAKIQEINIVRKHISKVKGGRLAEYFYPNLVISLVISDVAGDDIESIASGPTAYDSSTFKQAYEILAKYDILDKVPINVINYLQKGIRDGVKETPKKMQPNSKIYIIGSNNLSLEAMIKRAEELNLSCEILTNKEDRETNEAAKYWASKILSKQKIRPFVYIVGGETRTKPIANKGQGGRNMHYVVRSLVELENLNENWAIASVSTDGSDFMDNVAGGIIDNHSSNLLKKPVLNAQNYLERYDTYNILRQIDGVVFTDDTGTNVGDIAVYFLN